MYNSISCWLFFYKTRFSLSIQKCIHFTLLLNVLVVDCIFHFHHVDWFSNCKILEKIAEFNSMVKSRMFGKTFGGILQISYIYSITIPLILCEPSISFIVYSNEKKEQFLILSIQKSRLIYNFTWTDPNILCPQIWMGLVVNK